MSEELEGAELDLAVAKAIGWELVDYDEVVGGIPTGTIKAWKDERGVVVMSQFGYRPSTDWSQGGPLIEEYEIKLQPPSFKLPDDGWYAHAHGGRIGCIGPTPLIAAMRALVASKVV